MSAGKSERFGRVTNQPDVGRQGPVSPILKLPSHTRRHTHTHTHVLDIQNPWPWHLLAALRPYGHPVRAICNLLAQLKITISRGIGAFNDCAPCVCVCVCVRVYNCIHVRRRHADRHGRAFLPDPHMWVMSWRLGVFTQMRNRPYYRRVCLVGALAFFQWLLMYT